MLEVTIIIGGTVVAFIAMLLWANSGRLNNTE
jgi:hypothetical protein